MTPHDRLDESEMHTQLERLVAGEMDEKSRADILAWLEADPSHWRLCGLAFLETQAWSESLSGWASATVPQASSRPSPLPLPQSPRRRVRLKLRDAALTAGLLTAFVAGAMTRGMLPDSDRSVPSPDAVVAEAARGQGAPADTATNDGPLMATVVLPPVAAGAPSAEVRLPVVKSNTPSAVSNTTPPPLPDSVRRQWERRGYTFDAERRYLLARLPDGEQVAVPIERLLVSFVGNKVY
jgi:hypothetical protein